MFLMDITGRDRGFGVGADHLSQTLDGVSLATIWDEYLETLSIWNEKRSALASLFSATTTKTGDAVAQSEHGDEFEEASEFGLPKSTRPTVAPLVMGYPLFWFDLAARYTETFLRDATASEVRAVHANALEADNRLVFRAILKALFNKGNGSTNENGATIYGLWDGATGTPPEFNGKTFDGLHSHYLVSGAATIDGGDLRDLTNTITEHGYGLSQRWPVAILVNPEQGDTIRGFRADLASNPATKPFDFIPAGDAPARITVENIVGDLPPEQVGGLPVFGSYGKALLVEDYLIPSGYAVAVATDTKPLAFREHERAEFRGLRVIPGRADARTPLIEARYQRGFGVGIQKRGAAAVMQVKASGSYEAPNGYVA